MITDLRNSFQQYFDAIISSAPQIVFAIILFLIFVIIGIGLSKAIRKITSRYESSVKKTQFAGRLTRWIFNVIGFAVALHVVGLTEAAKSILAAGGILTIVLGFAFKDIGENLLAGFLLSFSRSFDVGDLIESDGILGTVKGISVRDVHVRTGDGIDIFIPSAIIFKNALKNYTRDGLRRGNFTIGVDYRNDSATARALIEEAITSVTGVLSEPGVTVRVAEFSPNYIDIEALFWINTFDPSSNLTSIRTEAMENSIKALLNNDYTVSSEISTAVEVTQK